MNPSQLESISGQIRHRNEPLRKIRLPATPKLLSNSSQSPKAPSAGILIRPKLFPGTPDSHPPAVEDSFKAPPSQDSPRTNPPPPPKPLDSPTKKNPPSEKRPSTGKRKIKEGGGGELQRQNSGKSSELRRPMLMRKGSLDRPQKKHLDVMQTSSLDLAHQASALKQ